MSSDLPTVAQAQAAVDAAKAALLAAAAERADTAILAELIEAHEEARHTLYLAGEATKTVHVRKRRGRSLGRPGYSHQTIADRTGGYRDPASETLCGEPATTVDMSWADTRTARGLSYVTCEACKAARAATITAR